MIELTAREEVENQLLRIIDANLNRAGEGLRVLEEVAKMPGVKLDSDRYRRSRFALYTLEKALLSSLPRLE